MPDHETMAPPLHAPSSRSLPVTRGTAKSRERRTPGITVVLITRRAINALSPAAYARAVGPLIGQLQDHGMFGDDSASVEIVLAQERAENWGSQGTAIEITQRH